jgi:hypothetical protein
MQRPTAGIGQTLPHERLTVGRIATALDRGEWFEPEDHQ